MTDRQLPEFFADDVVQVTYADGVFRIFFSQSDGENGGPRQVFRLLVPVSQLPGIVGGLEGSVRDIAEKIRAQAAGDEVPAQAQAEPAPPAAAPVTAPVTAETPGPKPENGENGKSFWRKIKDRVQSPKDETD